MRLLVLGERATGCVARQRSIVRAVSGTRAGAKATTTSGQKRAAAAAAAASTRPENRAFMLWRRKKKKKASPTQPPGAAVSRLPGDDERGARAKGPGLGLGAHAGRDGRSGTRTCG